MPDTCDGGALNTPYARLTENDDGVSVLRYRIPDLHEDEGIVNCFRETLEGLGMSKSQVDFHAAILETIQEERVHNRVIRERAKGRVPQKQLDRQGACCRYVDIRPEGGKLRVRYAFRCGIPSLCSICPRNYIDRKCDQVLEPLEHLCVSSGLSMSLVTLSLPAHLSDIGYVSVLKKCFRMLWTRGKNARMNRRVSPTVFAEVVAAFCMIDFPLSSGKSSGDARYHIHCFLVHRGQLDEQALAREWFEVLKRYWKGERIRFNPKLVHIGVDGFTPSDEGPLQASEFQRAKAVSGVWLEYGLDALLLMTPARRVREHIRWRLKDDGSWGRAEARTMVFGELRGYKAHLGDSESPKRERSDRSRVPHPSPDSRKKKARIPVRVPRPGGRKTAMQKSGSPERQEDSGTPREREVNAVSRRRSPSPKRVFPGPTTGEPVRPKIRRVTRRKA